MINELLDSPVLSHNTIQVVREVLEKNNKNLQITGVVDTGLSHVMSTLAKDHDFNVIITFSEIKAREIYETLKYYIPDVLYYPSKDFIFYSADISGKTTVSERINVMKAINSGHATIVTTGSGLLDKLIPFDMVENNMFTIDMDSIIEIDALKKKLVSLGYSRTDEIDGKGQFSIRGSIVDIFPLTSDTPYRIDLFDDEIDSMKSFDIESQRTIENITSFSISPASEYILTKDTD